MAYTIKEIYYTLQGEGAHTGRPAVFCRFTGCNLWSGHEADRDSAVCQFCDTDFVGTDGPGGGTFRDATAVARAIAMTWPTNGNANDSDPFVVFTGGEPLLQLDAAIVQAVHNEGFTIAIETNGTRSAPTGIDWICMSPKAGTELELRTGNELKLVFPQAGAEPEQYASLNFEHFFLQPMDGPNVKANTEQAIAYCLKHPRWQLSLQQHKLLGLR